MAVALEEYMGEMEHRVSAGDLQADTMEVRRCSASKAPF